MSEAIRLDHLEPEHGRTFVVNWCMTSVCNYTCSYCPPPLHDKRLHFPAIETVLSFFRQIREQRPGYRVAIELTGGEVTLWPQFIDCAAELKKEGALLGILSNGSRPLSWWEKATPCLDKVVLSFHSESASFDRFLEVVSYLRTRVSLHVNVIMHPRRFRQCLTAARILSELDEFSIALQPVLVDLNSQDGSMVNYTVEQLETIQAPFRLLREPKMTREVERFRGPVYLEGADGSRSVRTPQEILASGANRWRGWACSMGLQQIAVEPDGSIFGGYCRQGPQLGNVHERRVNLPSAPLLCRSDTCNCYFDVQCTKVRVARP